MKDNKNGLVYIFTIAKNIHPLGKMVSQRYERPVLEDFEKNKEKIMSIFSALYTVYETVNSFVPEGHAVPPKELELICAVSCVASHLFTHGSYDTKDVSDAFAEIYNKNLIAPHTTVFKAFYDYVRLVLRESNKHNKRLKLGC